MIPRDWHPYGVGPAAREHRVAGRKQSVPTALSGILIGASLGAVVLSGFRGRDEAGWRLPRAGPACGARFTRRHPCTSADRRLRPRALLVAGSPSPLAAAVEQVSDDAPRSPPHSASIGLAALNPPHQPRPLTGWQAGTPRSALRYGPRSPSRTGIRPAPRSQAEGCGTPPTPRRRATRPAFLTDGAILAYSRHATVCSTVGDSQYSQHQTSHFSTTCQRTATRPNQL